MTSDDRLYFDFCDRLALRRLLPKQGEKIIDICGGFGRLKWGASLFYLLEKSEHEQQAVCNA